MSQQAKLNSVWSEIVICCDVFKYVYYVSCGIGKYILLGLLRISLASVGDWRVADCKGGTTGYLTLIL